MFRRVSALILIAAACGDPDSQPLPIEQALIEQALPESLPAELTAFLADSARAGFGARVLGSWGLSPRHFVAVAWHPHPDGYREHRLSVLTLAGDSIVLRARDRGMGDGLWDALRVFTGGPSTILLGEVENEYSWGLAVLAVDSAGVIADLRFPGLSLPDTSEFAGGPSTSALAAARVTLRDDRLHIAFDSDLIFDPGGRSQATWCRRDSRAPIEVQRTDTGWTVANAVTIAANNMSSCESNRVP